MKLLGVIGSISGAVTAVFVGDQNYEAAFWALLFAVTVLVLDNS